MNVTLVNFNRSTRPTNKGHEKNNNGPQKIEVTTSVATINPMRTKIARTIAISYSLL
jgi:hypothetical protein